MVYLLVAILTWTLWWLGSGPSHNDFEIFTGYKFLLLRLSVGQANNLLWILKTFVKWKFCELHPKLRRNTKHVVYSFWFCGGASLNRKSGHQSRHMKSVVDLWMFACHPCAPVETLALKDVMLSFESLMEWRNFDNNLKKVTCKNLSD